MIGRRDDSQAVAPVWPGVQPMKVGRVPADAQAGDAALDLSHDVLADALFHVYADVAVGGGLQECRDVLGQGFGQDGRGGQDAHLPLHAAGVGRHVAFNALRTGQYRARVFQQCFAGLGGFDAPTLARQQLGAHGVFQLRQPFADGRADDVGALAGAGDVAGFTYGDEQAQGGDVQVAHGGAALLRSSRMEY
ncbi:hypothetical protein D3C71_1163980 [compost metagenome]